ncbi:polysaccharide deacetylase [Opitutaceae bacterium EW11]|nr:polysaccharide deacetylase [Opitutaceae bacterium EW11]
MRPFYYSLWFHRRLFESGVPILAYHKVDRRPRRARFRSIYMAPELFDRQMRQLAAAGFTTAKLGDPFPPAGNERRKVVLTFDDGYVSAFKNALPVLRRHAFSGIQFLVADHIGDVNAWDVREGELSVPLMGREQVREWLAAGHEIGSHTLSHPRLTRLTAPQQRAEIRDSKAILEDMFDVPVKHFCYPYGDCDEALAEIVADAGYATASTLFEGVNTQLSPAHLLPRIEARHPPRNLRWVWTCVKSCFPRL